MATTQKRGKPVEWLDHDTWWSSCLPDMCECVKDVSHSHDKMTSLWGVHVFVERKSFFNHLVLFPFTPCCLLQCFTTTYVHVSASGGRKWNDFFGTCNPFSPAFRRSLPGRTTEFRELGACHVANFAGLKYYVVSQGEYVCTNAILEILSAWKLKYRVSQLGYVCHITNLVCLKNSFSSWSNAIWKILLR